MIKIIIYLCVSLFVTVFLSIIHYFVDMPCWYVKNLLYIRCTYIGVAGGILYCLRAVYLHKCVRKAWDKVWEVWYYLRPILSGITGFASCIFLKAGLLILEADPKEDAISFGYLALAFIAGYNVDNFWKKMESVASSLWGIEESGVAKGLQTKDQDKQEPEA